VRSRARARARTLRECWSGGEAHGTRRSGLSGGRSEDGIPLVPVLNSTSYSSHSRLGSERAKEGGRQREKDRPTYITIIQHTHKNLEDLNAAGSGSLCERSRRERTSEVIRLVGKRVGTLCETKGLSRVTCLLPLVKGAATRFQLGKLSGIRRNAESNSRTYNANEFNVRSR